MVISYPVPPSISAAFPISNPSPNSSSSWVPFSLTQEEINAFHSVDRSLYTRLVIRLRRHPVGSMHVMGLWIWFERTSRHKGNLINVMLNFSDDVISILADEAVLCLMCVEHDHCPLEIDYVQIPSTQSLTGTPVTLRYFHENRVGIRSAVMKIVDEVCVKALQDIMLQAIHLQSSEIPTNTQTYTNYYPDNARVDPRTNFHAPNPSPNPNPNPNLAAYYFMNPRASSFQTPTPTQVPFSYFSNPIVPLPPPPTLPTAGSSSSSSIPQACAPPFIKEGGYLDLLTKPSHPFELEEHKEFLNNELAEVLSRLHIEVSGEGGSGGQDGEQRGQEVPPDERTIFLTFSKGYPLTENEVREFFTRRYGNCFEAIYMQEVTAPGDQALYARLVVRSAATINFVLNGRSKAKFSINGKHVWARKYVRKIPKSPSGGASPSSSPNSRSPVSMSLMMRSSSSLSQQSVDPIQFGSL